LVVTVKPFVKVNVSLSVPEMLMLLLIVRVFEVVPPAIEKPVERAVGIRELIEVTLTALIYPVDQCLAAVPIPPSSVLLGTILRVVIFVSPCSLSL